jgi:DNA primase catalytic core
MIPQDIIQETKKQHNLVDYVQGRGLQLKKSGHAGGRTGGEYSGLCPFHDDHNPSFFVNPSTNLWYCFACDMGGDVIKFVELYDKVSFNKAIEILGGAGSPTGDLINGTAESVHGGALSRPVLLKKVFDFYCRTFTEDKRGPEYLKSRNLTDLQLFKSFRFGFSNGTLLKTLTPDQKKQLKEIGILTKNNSEFFHNCVIFPLVDPQGNLINLYGRHISKDLPREIQNKNSSEKVSKTVISRGKHFYLPGELKGLFYPPKETDSIIITEGIIDALTLHQAGYHNVLPIFGVNGFTQDHLSFIQQQRINKITLCLDADESGRNAEPKLKEKLEALGVTVSAIHLPDGLDINEFFQSHSKADFEQLLTPQKQENPEKGKPAEQLTPVGAQVIDGGYIFSFDQRKYRTLGMNLHGLDRLKVNLKISKNGSFHIDTLDLYSSRARANFIESSSKLLNVDEPVVTQEINQLIELLEDKRLEIITGNQEEKPLEMTEAERKEALRFLKNPDLLNEIQSDFDKCGYIGEETARLFGYLSSVSRFLKSPLGLLIVSRSAAGKSFLQDAVCRFVPPEDLQKYTRITGQSLFYKEQDALKNKVLAIAEEKGAEDAIYSIRTLQSDQYLTVAVTITDPNSGQKRTEEYQVEGPVVIIITTTNPEALDFETRNRFVILTIDESREQTRKILQRQREADSLEGLIQQNEEERIYKKHHNAQRLLRPLEVVNPFHNDLTYPDNQLLMRREQKKYLTLIKTIAFLRQYQRKIKTINNNGSKTRQAGAAGLIEYVEVTLDDIELANKLACDILGRSLDELSPHTRGLLKEIKRMVDNFKGKRSEIRFTRKQICDATGWSYWQIRPHLEQLTEMEYLHLHSGKQGQRHSYELLWDGQGESGEKFMTGLIDVKTLRKSAKTLQRK